MRSDPGSPSHSEQKHQTLVKQARAESDVLLNAMHRLEAALASAAPTRERAWHTQVLEELRTVTNLLDEHAHSVEAADGLLAMIGAARPRLLHRIERLRREHVALRQQAGSLQGQIEHLAPDELPNFRDIRHRTTWLLDALRHHRAAAADLLFEAFSTDVGVGD